MRKFLLFTIFLLSLNISFALDLSIRKYPESPKEGEEVKLTLESDKYDLNIANIVWTVDGEEQDSGIGRKTFTFRTSGNGVTQVVVARVTQEGYDEGVAQTVLEANSNFLLYEGADSYVPSFYKGRRLPGKEGVVRISYFSFKDGVIDGFNQSSTNNYYWKINGEDKNDISGPNKIFNKIIAKVTDSAFSIQTTKEDLNGNRKVSNLTIPLQLTETLLYKTDENRLTKNFLSESEMGRKLLVVVEPFFFSVSNKRDPDLTYTWKINDVVSPVSNPWGAVFTGKDNESVLINLDVINNKKITQESSQGFTFKVQ